MASQSTKAPPGGPAKAPTSEKPKRTIKNPLLYAGTVVLLVIVVIAFVFVPAFGGSIGSGGDALEFGSYAGKAIAYSQGSFFASQVQDLNDRLRDQGLNEQNFQFFAYQVWRGAFERTVVRAGIIDAVKKAGGFVTEERLDEAVADHPSFQENGKFSPRRYREASLGEKLKVRDGLRDDLLTQQYYSDVFSVATSSREIEFVKAMSKDTRSIEYAAFPLSSYPDDEVVAWAKSSSGLFRRMSLSRITLTSSEADAAKVLKQVQDNAVAFDEAAKSHSKDAYADKGGSVGLVYAHDLQGDLENKEEIEKILSLKKGELSPVLKTVTGSWVFFRADEAASEPDFSDPETLKSARDYMEGYERGKIEDWLVAKAAVFSEDAAADFSLACRKAGLVPKSAGPFPLNYGDLSVSVYGQTAPIFKPVSGEDTPELSGASLNERFLSAVFSTAPGSLTEPIVHGDNVLVVKVKEAAAAAEEDSSSIDVYFPYFAQQKTSAEIQEAFLKSPSFKDDFSEVFFKYFSGPSS